MGRSLALVLVFLYSLPAFAPDDSVARADQAERFVVKVVNQTSNVFAPDIEQSHGTGFIVELTPNKGVVFTNNHVVATSSMDAQRVMLQFPATRGLPETVVGRVVYRSPLLDFAVVEFDPSKLKRVGKNLKVAALAEPSEFEALTPRGTQVMAFGHPLDSSNVSTFGVISGFMHDRNAGVFLQTSAAINPGNSGGPLLEMVQGKVIGMNTMKRTDADNTGYAIPINVMLEMYRAWRQNSALGYSRGLLARLYYFGANSLQLEGLVPLVTSECPDFFETHEGMYIVADADAKSNLKVGDLIFKVEGEVIGFDGHRMDQLALNAGKTIKARVIRDNRFVDVECPIVSSGYSAVRQEVDFVLLSGLLLNDQTPEREWGITNGASRVVVSKVLKHTPAFEVGQIHPGSVVIALQIAGKTYPVTRLSDVKRALRQRAEGQPVRIVYHPPILIPDGQGSASLMSDRQFGGASILRDTKVTLVPVDQVLTPRELSLSLMKKHFDFTGKNPERRDYRHWIGKKKCALEIAEASDDFELL